MTRCTVNPRTNRYRWLRLTLAFLALVLPRRAVCDETLSKELGEYKLAQLLDEITTTSEPIEGAIFTELLVSDWPQELMPRVLQTLSSILKERADYLDTRAVQIFAERNGKCAALLVPYIGDALPEADRREMVDLLRAVRAIGPQASSLEDIVRANLGHSDAIVVIHSASALVRIAPLTRDARARLLSYLLSEDPEYRWRAADAMAHAPVMDERWVAELEALFKDDDVRARVTSAYALWQITDNATVSLPVLLASLAEEDRSLATAYVFPSFRGDSHRVYALKAIVEMGVPGTSAIPQVISVIQDVENARTPKSEMHAILGLVALQAICHLGPVTQLEFNEIEKSVACDACAFALVREKAQKVLALIRQRKI